MSGATVKISRFKYNSLGQIASKTFGNGQTVKYSYNLRGWTTGISNKLFSETLTYNTDVNGLLPDNPVYNGNISAIRWKSDNLWRGYQFKYDRMGRLTESIYGEGSSVSSNKGRFNEKLSYDMMGNVLSVLRNGKFRNGIYGPIDDLTMEYEGNRLVKADDAVDGPYYAGAFHFVDGVDEDEEYSYDANGNMTSDLNKNITQIDYNCLNLPTMIRFGDGSKYMSMKYDAAGRLLRRTTRVPFEDIAVGGKLQQGNVKGELATLGSRFVARNGAAASATSTAGSSSGSSAATPSLAPSTTLQGTPSSVSSSVVPAISGKVSMRTFGMTDYDYCGNVEYTNDKAVLYHSEGYVTFDKNQQPEFHYYLKDHLGNVRVVFNERDSVEQVTHYYPLGGSFGDGVGSSVQDYLYSGKELTRFNVLNWYNYGARWYDPATLRWNGVDKLAEKHYENTPNMFCGNNPILFIDPNGLDYWSTSDPEQIQRFMSELRNNDQHDMSGWQHTTDANFLANLFYNDKTNNFVYSYNKVENGEVVCCAHIFTPIDRNWIEDINTTVDCLANSLENNSGKSVVGSNGKIYWQQKGRRPFYGNKNVKTYPLAKIGKKVGKFTGTLDKLIASYEMYTAIQNDKGVGYNALKVGAGWLGGTVVGTLLMQYGGQVGGLVGGPAGAVVGGFLGGVAGAYGGSYLGETLIDYVYGVEE
ncbi:MAG: hypothetical protein J6I34_04305 [Prevotella sp.]|nr:hypothetical protein [Prevotella sp.]